MKPVGLSGTFTLWERETEIANVDHEPKHFPKSCCFSIRISSLTRNDLNKKTI